MDAGVPKNLEVGGGYDFFVILACRRWGGGSFWGFVIFDDLPQDYLI